MDLGHLIALLGAPNTNARTGPERAMQGTGVGAWLDALSGPQAFTSGGVAKTAWATAFDLWVDRGDLHDTNLDGSLAGGGSEKPINRQHQRGNTPRVAFTSGTPANVANIYAASKITNTGGGSSFYFCIAFNIDPAGNRYYTSILGDAGAGGAIGNTGWHLSWNADNLQPWELSIGTGAARSVVRYAAPAGWSQYANMPDDRYYVIEGYLSGTTLGLRVNKGAWATATVGAMSAGNPDVWVNPGASTGYLGGGWCPIYTPFILVRKNDVPDSNTRDQVANYAQATFGGSLFVATEQHTSTADPASYSMSTGTTTRGVAARFSVASPATYAYSTPAGTIANRGYASIASPATYTLAGVDATGLAESVQGSAADPAVFTFSPAPATGNVALVSVALPATYATTPAAATVGYRAVFSTALAATYSYTPDTATTARFAWRSVGLPATYLLASPSTTRGTRQLYSTANPAAYAYTAAPATSGHGRLSIALPATYTWVRPNTRDLKALSSQASPAAYLTSPVATADETTGETETVEYPVPPARVVLTDLEFQQWLHDETAIRVVLVEMQCIDENGNTEQVYLGSRGFATKLEDGQNGRYYLPLMRGGLEFAQSLDYDLSGSHSYGDIQLDNTEGDLDWMFERYWQYQPIRAYVGDARWPRRDFRQIFDGAIEDIDSVARDTVNVGVRDKLHRLDMPLHEDKVSGNGPEAGRMQPLAFGECHNVTPVLVDPTQLRYIFHAGVAEGVFEVRDNGVPVQRSTNPGPPATFSLARQPYGRITCSVQGDIRRVAQVEDEGYANTVAELIMKLAKHWGTEQGKRFTDADFDQDNFTTFSLNNQQPVGLYIEERTTVLDACQEIAASVGARLTMTATGKLQLIKLEVPPIGSPVYVGESDMVAGSLHIADRMPLVSGVNLGYCKNWTVQEDTAAGLPEEHKAMFAREWYTTAVVNPVPRDTYGMWGEPEQENCLLLARDDAINEAGRRLRLRSAHRHVIEFEGFANLMFTQVGSAMNITHPRFGLSKGKTGQVVSVAVNWLTTHVTIRVLI